MFSIQLFETSQFGACTSLRKMNSSKYKKVPRIPSKKNLKRKNRFEKIKISGRGTFKITKPRKEGKGKRSQNTE